MKHVVIAIILTISASVLSASELVETFRNPPDTARPGVYWYFMDGNMDRDEMVADLEIEVVNRWINRLLGAPQPEDKGIRILKWEYGLLSGKSFKTGRYPDSTHCISKSQKLICSFPKTRNLTTKRNES